MPTNITRHITPLRILFATAAILLVVAAWLYISSYLARPKITTDYTQKLTDLAREYQPGSDTQPNRRDEFVALARKVEQLQADVGQGEDVEVRALLADDPSEQTDEQFLELARRFVDTLAREGIFRQANQLADIRHSTITLPKDRGLADIYLNAQFDVDAEYALFFALLHDAETAAENGQPEAAIDRIKSALAIARLTSSAPFILNMVSGVGMEAMTHDTIRDLVTSHTFNRDQLNEIARVIDEQKTVPVHYHLRTERMVLDDALQNIYSEDGMLLPSAVADYVFKLSNTYTGPTSRHVNFLGLFAPSRSEVDAALDEIFETAIEYAKDPSRPIRAIEEAAEKHEELIDNHPLLPILMPSVEGPASYAAGMVASRAGTTTTLALEHHYADRGAYPATLDALVPEYIDQLPEDPNAPDGKLIYEPNNDASAYTLYSVGQNRVDDNASEDDDIILVTQ